jgi:ribosomal protein L37AE/L43A
MTAPKLRRASALLLAAATLIAPEAMRADIIDTKHNLSASGPGPLRAVREREICRFCHTPHVARREAPLWNRRDSGRTYVKYWSSTLDAYGPGESPEVDGASRLCLSCHDGTVALGEVLRGGAIAMRPGAERIRGRGEGLTGGDLSGSHPVSFRITETLIARNNQRGDLPLRPLAQIKADRDVRLDSYDKVQCTTCHDPHSSKNDRSSGVPFYRKPRWEEVCLTCHEY